MRKREKITFADVVNESLFFDGKKRRDSLVLDLIDTKWFQRLRDISQTGNTRLVYMFSEHSRFGHCLEVAYLAGRLLDNLNLKFSKDVKEYELAIMASALLHDLAHLAPGSHTAQKAWFPNENDQHEKIASKIILNDSEIKNILESYEKGLTNKVKSILLEDRKLPKWVWQIISGGGWNVDRGSWCVADSVMAGVSYGKYNITALTDSITITSKKELALNENRLDSMLHFAVSRHAMYKQIYQHRVLLATDKLIQKLVVRLREVDRSCFFADQIMCNILDAKSVNNLAFSDIFAMRESWWRYHLFQWQNANDEVVKDLATRLINRALLKTVYLSNKDKKNNFQKKAKEACEKLGFNPKYYLYKISSSDRFKEDAKTSLKVIKDDGSVLDLKQADSLFQSLLNEQKKFSKTWLVMPVEVKQILQRER